MRSTSATLLPPYFWTTIDIGVNRDYGESGEKQTRRRGGTENRLVDNSFQSSCLMPSGARSLFQNLLFSVASPLRVGLSPYSPPPHLPLNHSSASFAISGGTRCGPSNSR